LFNYWKDEGIIGMLQTLTLFNDPLLKC